MHNSLLTTPPSALTATNPSPVEAKIQSCEKLLQDGIWQHLEAVERITFERVLESFRANHVGEEHFYCVTGYGHDDMGREVLDKVFAGALQAEAALVRPHIVSGTHAIALMLQGCLANGDQMLSLTGPPYDTLEEVIGIRGNNPRSLTSQGITYNEYSIFPQNSVGEFTGKVDLQLPDYLTPQIKASKVIYLQRSRGYALRPVLTIPEIKTLTEQIRTFHPEALILVDNCYGEFVEANEPTAVGVDLIAGSLIKNPGGGIVPTGGYIAGKAKLVEACGNVLTCPGIGADGGYMFNLTRTLLQGLFLAPGVVKQTLKGMTLAAALFEAYGLSTTPSYQTPRGDIIQAIALGSENALKQFCQMIQAYSPISSYLTPVPSPTPGYADEIMMAGGTFIDGSSIELSADGPMRPPYTVFFQGGLNYYHTRKVLLEFLQAWPG